MPTQVEVAGEGILEFPDGMGDDEIQSVLRKQFPVSETPKPDFRRDELAKQTFQARLEGEQAKALTGLTDIGAEAAKAVVRAASHVDPTGFTQGLMQQYGVEPTHVIPPESVLSDVRTVSQFAREGLGNLGIDPNVIIPEQYRKPAEEFVAETIASTPEMAPLLAVGTVAPRPVGRIFQAQMLQGVPQTAYAAATAPTAEERIKAGIQTGAGLAFPALIERGMRQPSIPIPDFIGRQLEMQRGAIPPRGEPVAPIERVTPEQAAIAAERMSAPFEAEVKPSITTQNEQPTVPELDIKPTEQRRIETYGERYIRESGPEAARKRIEHLNQRTEEELAQRPIDQNAIRRLQQEAQNIANALDKPPAKKPSVTPTAPEPPKPEVAAGEGKAKELWEMTKGEFAKKQLDDWKAYAKTKPNVITDSPYSGWRQLLNGEKTVAGDVMFVNGTPKGEPTIGRIHNKNTDHPVLRPPEVEHKMEVSKALQEGKPVPAEVLADYPDLKPTPKPTETPVEAAGKGESRAEVEQRFLDKFPDPLNTAELNVTTDRKIREYQKKQLKEKYPDYVATRHDAFVDRWNYQLGEARRIAYERNRGIQAHDQPAQPITQGAGEKIVGMGGATPSELTAKTLMQSAIKNAAVDRDRIERGEVPMMDALRKGDPELWSQAMNVIDQDWTAADKLIARHKANPFIPTDVETMVLLHRRVDLKNEFNKANREAVLAEQEGRGDSAEAAKAVRDSMGDKLLELEEVMGKGDTAMGTMAGRAFRARQLVMNEDFSMADLVTLRESDLGRKLTSDEVAQLQKISDENARLNNEFAALLEAHEKNQAAVDMRKAVADSEARAKALPYHPRILELAEGYAKKWDERGSQALADLKAMFGEGQAFSGAPISPAMLDKAIIYGTSKIVRGAVDFAKWSDSMIRDLGPGFANHAKAVWNASKKAFDADVASAFKKQGAATVQKVKGALKADLGTETILKKIQIKVDESKGLLPDLKYHLDKLLDFYVRKGLKEEGPLLDAIHADVRKVIPDITRRETREILAGYGSFKPLSKDSVSVIKRDMHGQWQEISKIDMIQRGIFPPKLQERATMTDKQRWLRKQYEEQKRLHPEVTPTDAESQLKTALQSAKTRITNQITDLEHQIQTRTKIVRETKKLKPDAELERLTAIRDEMKAVYDTVFKKPELTDSERLEIWKERTRDRIAELTEKVRTKNFQPRKKPEPLKYDKEAERIRFELHKVHRALLDLRYNDQMSKRNATQKAFDAVANTVWFQRAMMTTGEFSGVLRQGGAMAYQNPTIAIKNLKPMMEAFKSEQNQFRIMEEILTRDNAPLYEKYGLEFTEAGTRLSSMEEHFMFRLSENMQKQPGLKQLVGTVNRFQRAYTVFLNKMRADVFDAMADTWGKDPVTLEQIANAINVFSGRGSKGVGKFLGSGQLANTIAFAPKYAISRIQMLALQPMWHGNLHTRKMIAWQYLKMLRGPAALYALGTLMGGKIGTDSNSSDFGKLIIGNTRIDPWMGILQPAVLFSRLGSGKKTTAAGRSVPIRGKVPYGGDNAWDLIANFGRGKLSPSVGSVVSVLSGEDPTGNPFDISDALKTTFYPMTYRDIIKLYGEHGIPEATAMSALGVLGVGINTYDKQKKTNQPNW